MYTIKYLDKPIDIREAKVSDAAKLMNLQENLERSGFMLHEPGERARTLEDESLRLEKVAHTLSTNIWVVELNNDIIAQITVVRGEAKRRKHSAYLALGVHSDYQNRGIAGELLEYVFAWAKTADVKRLELTVMTQNTGAVHLYKKKGFKVEGEKINSLLIDNRFVNEYYMYKSID